MTKCEFRTATTQDAYEFYNQQPPFSFKGIVAVKDEKIVGIGGIYREAGNLVAFSDLDEAMRGSKKDLVRGCRAMMEIIEEQKRPVYAVANKDEPTSESLLQRLGFVPTGMQSPMGEILIREGK